MKKVNQCIILDCDDHAISYAKYLGYSYFNESFRKKKIFKRFINFFINILNLK